MNNKRKYLNKTFATFLGFLVLASPMGEKVLDFKNIAQTDFQSWKRVHSLEGKCSVSFPKTPEHIQQKMPMKGGDQELQYYVYVADYDKKEVFMILVAQYPGKVGEENAVKNLEHFLNSLILQNSKNRLVFADLIKVQGFPGMDFHIKTDQVYFKGRAVQANNSLYLLAMECEIPNYQDEHFKYFIDSFELHTSK